jgi:cell division transport system permease protein
MFTILSRIFHFGVKNFWRNGWLSVATVAVMVLALLMLMSLLMFGVVTTQAIASIQDKIDISVYFKNATPEDAILNIKQSIESLSQVKNVDYTSSDQALEIFKEKHKDEPTITEAIAQLSTNPLEASLNIKAKDPQQYGDIAQYFSESPAINQYIDSISYYKNQQVIDRLNSIVKNVNRGGLVLTLILALIASLMIFNTIWLATFSNREEIVIMRVVGASNALVRGPYLVEGIMSGVFAAVIGIVIATPLAYYVSPFVKQFIPSFDFLAYFLSHALAMFGYELLFGIGIGLLSSSIAIRRYLKN